MEEEEENPNSIELLPELLEEVFIRMSVNSILKCRTVSKHWRSILESRKFAEKRRRFQKSRKILAAYNCNCGGLPILLPESRFEGDEEIVDLHCNAARLSMTCEGLVCFLEQDWIIVLNPSTRQLRRFPSGLNYKRKFGIGLWSTFNPRNWAMGFGRDKVTGMYKVVRMCFAYRHFGQQNPQVECGILDVQTGEWRKLNPPPHVVSAGCISTYVNGSVYWLQKLEGSTYFKLLALDLHKEEFSYVTYVPAQGMQATLDTQLVNIEDRLVLALTRRWPEWILKIWSMDTYRKRWSQTHYIRLENRVGSLQRYNRWFKPVGVSKQGNLVFCDNQNGLFKYYPKTDEIRCLSSNTCVISPYIENLVPLPLKPSHPHPDPVNLDFKTRISTCRLFSRPDDSIFKFVKQHVDFLFLCLVVTGYVCVPL